MAKYNASNERLKRECFRFVADPKTIDPATALFPDEVIASIRACQPARLAQLEAMLKDRTPVTVIDSLTKELASKGALGVLRHSIKCYGKESRLACFQPNSAINQDAAARYAANRLTIMAVVLSAKPAQSSQA